MEKSALERARDIIWSHILVLQMGKLRPRRTVGMAQSHSPISGRAQMRIQVA